ncbi:MAG: hypothetical protein H8E66_30670 [Planctomycetes bacterium]|nr:hypothetical protein [Planctomycetota bacterium]
MVRTEIWTYVLAYDLTRTIIAQAAIKHRVGPGLISFQGAIQTLEAFQPLITIMGERDPTLLTKIYRQLLDAIVTHRVADRPDRFEPRRRKRRRKPYFYLTKPRHEAKLAILKGLTDY